MYRFVCLLLIAVMIVTVLVGCGVSTAREATQLEFRAPMEVNSRQHWHVSLGVWNVGEATFRAYQAFNGAMELRDGVGEEVGRIQVSTLWDLEPDQPAWPASFRSKLAPGAYTLTWSAPDYGGIVVDFTVIELDGWLYLGEEWIRTVDGELVPDEREHGAFRSLVSLASVDLAQRLGIDPEAVIAEQIEEGEFPDASLGGPEPSETYAQVLTPGYSIKLVADGEVYEYRASSERLVIVPQEGEAPQGSVSITGVQVIAGERIIVRGRSTLPNGTCLETELYADGGLQSWWPAKTCVPVEDGTWQVSVPLGEGEAPVEVEAAIQYVVRAYQQDGPDIVSVFAFDVAGPPTPSP